MRRSRKSSIHFASIEYARLQCLQMNALLGFVTDVLISTILSLNLDRSQEIATLRAFNKPLWLQNDLINRHYQVEPSAG